MQPLKIKLLFLLVNNFLINTSIIRSKYKMISSEEAEEIRELQEIKKYVDEQKSGGSRMFVSGWDDDTEDIEELTPDNNSASKILWAAENGELDIVKQLATADPSLLSIHDEDGYTPLHRACYNDHVSIVEYLLSAGADHASVTLDKWQPLHSACHWNNALCAVKLLENGADVNARTAGGQTPLHLAASHGSSKDTLELLLFHPLIQTDTKNSAGESAYEIAYRSGPYHRLFQVFQPGFTLLEDTSDLGTVS